MLLRIIALTSLLLSTPLTAEDDPEFERRWQSLLAGGYEPLTIPTEWYSPVAAVKGAETPILSMAPHDAGISPSALAAVSAWAENQNSTALLIARDGKLVFETYWQGTKRDTRFNPQSMSKTVLAMLIGIGIERGEITSVDAHIGDYLPEWKGEPRANITIRQMLWMATGLEQGDDGFGYAVTPENPIVRHSLGSDFTKLLFALEPVAQPGSIFDYNNQVNQLLGIIIERSSGMDYETALSQRIWQPLELREAALPLDREGGMALTSCCILSRPVDWLRIGGLFVSAGRYKGQQIVPEAWLDEMLSPSPAYGGYGYQVWVHDQTIAGQPPPGVPLIPWQSEPFASSKVIIFHGHGGQRTYVMPDKQLVIVRSARDWPQAWDDAVLPNVIWRGTNDLSVADKGEGE